MKVSICIASYNMAHLIDEAIKSCIQQDYRDIEIIFLDDASNDNTARVISKYFNFTCFEHFRSKDPSGTGGAFNKAISHATGDIIVLLCADDIFTDLRVISDIVGKFKRHKNVVHISRYYHQFIDGDPRPVRAWHCDKVMELANNPSGLAFRKSALKGCSLSKQNVRRSLNPCLSSDDEEQRSTSPNHAMGHSSRPYP